MKHTLKSLAKRIDTLEAFKQFSSDTHGGDGNRLNHLERAIERLQEPARSVPSIVSEDEPQPIEGDVYHITVESGGHIHIKERRP